jgi:hypothetical protein
MSVGFDQKSIIIGDSPLNFMKTHKKYGSGPTVKCFKGIDPKNWIDVANRKISAATIHALR